MLKAKVIRMELPPGRRILAVSDIHGTPDYLKAVLDAAGFCRDDILFVLGDVLEKGDRSLETLRYLMDLSATHTVHTLCGNCDDLVVGFVDGREELSWGFFDYYLHHFGRRCTLVQMGMEAGLTEEECMDQERLRAAISGPFEEEFAFLRGLPTIIETPSLLFVHGGVPSAEGMEELEAWRCMKNDDFLSQDTHLDRFCVVGHWPVTLYRKDYPCSDPIIDRERKIISIDGGCVLKADGQLNALVIPGPDREDFSWVRYDDCPVGTALDRQEESAGPVIIHWTDHDVDVLERGEEFSLVRHKATGRTLQVLTKYLNSRRGQDWCEDATDYRLGVEPGDALSIVEETSRGYLVKKNGVTGWYCGRLKPVENTEKIR